MPTAKLFMNGRSQAVRLPKDCRLPGKEVYVRRLGSSLVLTPKNKGWELLNEAVAMAGDFPRRDQPPEQFRREQA